MKTQSKTKSLSSSLTLSRKECYEIIKNTHTGFKFKQEFGFNYTNATNVTLNIFCKSLKKQDKPTSTYQPKPSNLAKDITKKLPIKKRSKAEKAVSNLIEDLLDRNVDINLLALALVTLVVKLTESNVPNLISMADATEIIDLVYGKKQ